MDLKNQVHAMRPDITAALAEVCKKYGMKSLVATHATYDPEAGSITFKLEGVVAGAVGKEGSLYKQAQVYDKDLPPLGTRFTSNGRTDEIIGMNSTGGKVLVLGDDGKKYWWRTEVLKRVCARTAAANAS